MEVAPERGREGGGGRAGIGAGKVSSGAKIVGYKVPKGLLVLYMAKGKLCWGGGGVFFEL